MDSCAKGAGTTMPNAKRNYKDSLFTDYFSDKRRLIDAYNAIAGTNFPETAEVRFETLENVLFGTIRNDIAFTIEGRYVVLIEHQSTINGNMPLRLLLYIARVYERIIPQRALYARAVRHIPAPEFIVIYNGKEPYPERKTLRLSDAFFTEGAPANLELTVTVLNINEGNNEEVLQKSKALSDYAAFVSLVNRLQDDDGLVLGEAIEKAVHLCVKRGIMGAYLETQGSEVRNMLITEFDMDEYREVIREEAREEGLAAGREEGLAEGIAAGREEGLAAGREEGIKEGIKESRADIARRMKAEGIEPALISKFTGLPEDEIATL
jgi:hypothetical protein